MRSWAENLRFFNVNDSKPAANARGERGDFRPKYSRAIRFGPGPGPGWAWRLALRYTMEIPAQEVNLKSDSLTSARHLRAPLRAGVTSGFRRESRLLKPLLIVGFQEHDGCSSRQAVWW